MKQAYNIVSIVNFTSGLAFSIKFFFVSPTLPGVYYGIVSWICALGFALLAKL